MSGVPSARRIFIKAPVRVADLAEGMGMKPYEVMNELIKQAVFPMPNAPIPIEAAAETAWKLGYELVIVHEDG